MKACADKSALVNSLKADNASIKQLLDKQVLEIQNLNEKISLQKSTQKQLFKELECSFIQMDKTIRHSETSDLKLQPATIQSALKRMSIGEGEAHFD